MNVENLIQLIKSKAAERTNFEQNLDFNAAEYSGFNFDSAHYNGCDDGEIVFARRLLKELDK